MLAARVLARRVPCTHDITGNGDFLACVSLSDEVFEWNPRSREHDNQVVRHGDCFSIDGDGAAAVKGSARDGSSSKQSASDGSGTSAR